MTALREVITGAADNLTAQNTVGLDCASAPKTNGRNLLAQYGTREWREAARALAVAELRSLARTAERDEGDFTGVPCNPLLTAKPEPTAPKDARVSQRPGRKSVKALHEIVPDFVKKRGASPKRITSAAQPHACSRNI